MAGPRLSCILPNGAGRSKRFLTVWPVRKARESCADFCGVAQDSAMAGPQLLHGQRREVALVLAPLPLLGVLQLLDLRLELLDFRLLRVELLQVALVRRGGRRQPLEV